MGARRPFFVRFGAEEGDRVDVFTRERQLEEQLTEKIEERVSGTEVLAVELLSPHRFCVYIDHPEGVDHALCERVTRELDEYRREYTIDVSSPGLERPLRKPAHFGRVVGRKVAVRTSGEIGGRKKFRGEVIAADDETISVGAEGGDAVLIPYEQIVRGNLIDEGRK
jgi:ribosome maturation factor RimP